MLKKVLIANRGEIACRVIRTCKRLGMKTVAIYSDADAHAAHTLQADERVHIGPAETKLSYLAADKIIAAAKATGADAVHPGYGFLSENADFAESLRKAGIIFIGPSPESIRLLGDKIASKEMALRLKVPLPPSINNLPADAQKCLAAIQDLAKKVGYPLLIKASAGGGGRGMRKVSADSELSEALTGARREAKAFFSDERVFVEKLVEPARHVEVQFFGDGSGDAVTLFDRDCSMQRNHQKVIEEAPAPNLPEKTRLGLWTAAKKLAGEAKYSGAGTAEFLVDVAGNYYFLEVNSRLQVEHPVTEAITELDLVELQLRIASGEKLKTILPKPPVEPKGAAIELRLCAEAPEEDFIAATGRIAALNVPADPWVRFDTGFGPGDRVTHYYDSLLGKLIVTGANRAEAIARTSAALKTMEIAGVKTNREFLLTLLETPEFANVTHHIKFAETKNLTTDTRKARYQQKAKMALAALTTPCTTLPSAWQQHPNFRLFGHSAQRLKISVNGLAFDFTIAGETLPETCWEGHTLIANFDGHEARAALFMTGRNEFWLNDAEGSYQIIIEPLIARQRSSATGAHDQIILAHLPGKIVEIRVNEGQTVETGTVLLVMESMKMEHLIKAPAAGTVAKIMVKSASIVEAKAPLLDLKYS